MPPQTHDPRLDIAPFVRYRGIDMNEDAPTLLLSPGICSRLPADASASAVANGLCACMTSFGYLYAYFYFYGFAFLPGGR